MSTKTTAVWASFVAGFLTITGIVAAMPGTLQDQIMQPFPEHARGYISVVFLLLGWLGRTYATKQAAASGPQTPPANPPK